jgi:adenosylmethionine-8-amino-7-oxononanoate aminotransferase
VQDLFAAGLLVRVTGDAVLVAPPFVAEPRHVDEIAAKLRGVLARY